MYEIPTTGGRLPVRRVNARRDGPRRVNARRVNRRRVVARPVDPREPGRGPAREHGHAPPAALRPAPRPP
ncbi:hypothetical protein, partial [Streptomyces sp. SolWspMP-sol7th]|uniref:hypothetical protein n=1 Tax=Streptomyces sp. SolWspMP-sol7th TaxID=1839776 RepID=UPI0020C7A251